MNKNLITELARKHLDEMVTVYFANEYIYGKWFRIDLENMSIGIDIRDSGKRSVYVDIDCITAMEVEDKWLMQM